LSVTTPAYGYPYCVERTRPQAHWRAVYDELYEGLTSGEGALSRDAASLALLEGWDAIVAELRRDERNARRRERYRIRKAQEATR
jgi:hypothetical protein